MCSCMHIVRLDISVVRILSSYMTPVMINITVSVEIFGSVIFLVNRERLFGREKFLVPRALPL